LGYLEKKYGGVMQVGEIARTYLGGVSADAAGLRPLLLGRIDGEETGPGSEAGPGIDG